MVTDLKQLLIHLQPVPDDRTFVFVVILEPDKTLEQDAFAIIREAEGTTLILEQARADDAQLPYAYTAARITLRVHSDLAAVGLTAAVSRVLAEARISCNVVAGYFHDHLFVPYKQRAQALTCLLNLTKGRL